MKSILPGGGYAPGGHPGPSCWRLHHHRLMASKETWASASRQPMEYGGEDVCGPAAVMRTTPTRTPLANALPMAASLCEENWENSSLAGREATS